MDMAYQLCLRLTGKIGSCSFNNEVKISESRPNISPLSSGTNKSEITGDPSLDEDLHQEINGLKNQDLLSKKINPSLEKIKIARVLDYGLYKYYNLDINLYCVNVYAVLPFIEISLDDYMKLHQLSCDQLFFIIENLLLFLSKIHEKNYLHLDLKPENLLLQMNGEEIEKIVVIDFELSKHGEYKKENDDDWGSQGYMSPEAKARGGDTILTEQSDIWSLGKIICRLLLLSIKQCPIEKIIGSEKKKIKIKFTIKDITDIDELFFYGLERETTLNDDGSNDDGSFLTIDILRNIINNLPDIYKDKKDTIENLLEQMLLIREKDTNDLLTRYFSSDMETSLTQNMRSNSERDYGWCPESTKNILSNLQDLRIGTYQQHESLKHISCNGVSKVQLGLISNLESLKKPGTAQIYKFVLNRPVTMKNPLSWTPVDHLNNSNTGPSASLGGHVIPSLKRKNRKKIISKSNIKKVFKRTKKGRILSRKRLKINKKNKKNKKSTQIKR